MPSPTFRAIAFSGSLRTGSSNTALIRLAQRIAPPELAVEIIDAVAAKLRAIVDALSLRDAAPEA